MSGSDKASLVNTAATAARGQTRNSLLAKAVLRYPGTNEEREVRVRNISSGGLMADAPVRAGRGESVELKLKNIGWISGKIAWIAESRFGVAFDHPIDPKAMQQSTGSKALEDNMPSYLRKLNAQSQITKPVKLRRL
jgi:hypothetical protein